jgi:hypothetical protein
MKLSQFEFELDKEKIALVSFKTTRRMQTNGSASQIWKN